MSTRELVDAIISGDASAIQTHFESALAERIVDRLDSMRREVAQGMFSEGAMTAAEKKKAQEVHRVLKDGESIGGAYASQIRQAHAQLKMKHGSDWRKKAGINEEFEDELTLEDFTAEELKEFMMSEDFEQLDELSKGTLASYYSKAIGDRHSKDLARDKAKRQAEPDEKEVSRLGHKVYTRSSGLEKAKAKFFSKEEVELDEEQLDEIDKLALRGMFSADPKSKQHIGVTTDKGRAARAKANVPVLKQVIARSLGKHPKANLPEDVELDEAVSSDSKNRYEYSNGSKPKGQGNWMFSSVHPRDWDASKHKEQTVSVQGSFSDAAKKAASHFKEKGHKGEIHVLS